MGNAMSRHEMEKVKYCRDYEHSNIVTTIYSVLSNYQIEAMCECASWLLREILLTYKKYKETDVDLLCSTVNGKYHVFVFDKVQHYYIDITSEQFEDTMGNQIQPCMGTKNIDDFVQLGYSITGENTNEVCASFCKESCVVYDNDNPITRMQLLDQIKYRLGMKGGKTRQRRRRKLHNHRKSNQCFT